MDDAVDDARPTPNQLTLAAYEGHVAEYVAGTPSEPSPAYRAWLEQAVEGLPGVPRYFCYWRADSLREVLTDSGFPSEVTPLPLGDPFLGVIARPAARRPA